MIFLSRAILLTAIFIGLSACQTLKTSTQPAVVEINHAYPQTILDASKRVMEDHGYRMVSGDVTGAEFEKPGSLMNELAYGSWLNDSMMERVKISIRNWGPDAFQVDCQALLVTRPESRLAETHRTSRFKRGKYQRILEEIREVCAY